MRWTLSKQNTLALIATLATLLFLFGNEHAWWPRVNLSWLGPYAGFALALVVCLYLLDSGRTLRRALTAVRRHQLGQCSECGYDRRGLNHAAPCPECGSRSPKNRA